MTSLVFRILGALVLIGLYQLDAAIGVAALAMVAVYIVVQRHQPPLQGETDATGW